MDEDVKSIYIMYCGNKNIIKINFQHLYLLERNKIIIKNKIRIDRAGQIKIKIK